MVQYKPPNREYEFILREVLNVEKELAGYEGYEEATWDMIEMISDQFGKMSQEFWLSSNRDGDEIGVADPSINSNRRWRWRYRQLFT